MKSPGLRARRAAAWIAIAALFLTASCCCAPAAAAKPKCTDVRGFTPLLRTGQAVNGAYYGALRTIDGSGGGYVYRPANPSNPYALPSNGAAVNADGAAKGLRAAVAYSQNPDIPTIHRRGKSYYMFVHRESYPGGMDVVEVVANKTGLLTAVSTADVDFAAAGGLWFPCSGTVLPLGDTHLGSEEFEPDCRQAATTGFGERSGSTLGEYGVTAMMQAWSYYQDLFPNVSGINASPGANLAAPPSAGTIDIVKANSSSTPPTIAFPAGALDKFNCYAYGWTPEASPPDPKAGAPAAAGKKWLTLGRLSHEAALMLYDGKTLLLTDDGSACILGMFVADASGDLSAGTLYAAKLSNQNAAGAQANGAGTSWDVTWIALGSNSQAALEALLPTIKFADMWETADVAGTGTAAACPDGFTLVVTVGGGSRLTQAAGGRYIECLKLKPGMQNVAAFFETRRMAAYMGATNEFEKLEGVTYNPITKKAYAAMARFSNGALAGTANSYNYDLVARDEMRLPDNRCGGVLELDLGGDWRPTKMTMLIAGTPADTASIPGLCDVNGVAGPDNLHMVPGSSTLLIAEDVDPSKGHPNNFLWAYDTLKPAQGLTRIATAPYDSEISGIYTAFVGDSAFLMYTMQHPDADLPSSVMLGTSAPGYVAYIGPVPIKALTGVSGVKPTAGGKADKASKKRMSTELEVWRKAKALQELTFEAVPYELPADDNYNAVGPASTGQVCGAARKKS